MEPVAFIVGAFAFVLLLWLSIKWLVLPIEMNKSLKQIIKELQAINCKLSAPPAPEVRETPATPEAAKLFSYSCEHCGGEFQADPRTPIVTCPHCQQNTIPQSPLKTRKTGL